MISVCIATHNGEKYIYDQLHSILLQLSAEDEIIISDDGSTDDTINEILKLGDKRIKLFHFSQPYHSIHRHLYVTQNFQNALNHANGDYIFDQDDVWNSGKRPKSASLTKS